MTTHNDPGDEERKPRLGQRVRFTGTHRFVDTGRTGFIECISDDQFFVMTDCGGWFGWTSFDSWAPTGEPDVELSDEFKAMREPCATCGMLGHQPADH